MDKTHTNCLTDTSHPPMAAVDQPTIAKRVFACEAAALCNVQPKMQALQEYIPMLEIKESSLGQAVVAPLSKAHAPCITLCHNDAQSTC